MGAGYNFCRHWELSSLIKMMIEAHHGGAFKCVLEFKMLNAVKYRQSCLALLLVGG